MAIPREITASVTERGQVTIPAEIRKALGLKKKGKVSFCVDENGVIFLQRPPFTIDTAFGSLKPVNMPEDWEARIREAKDEKAEETIRKMREN